MLIELVIGSIYKKFEGEVNAERARGEGYTV